MAKDKSKPGGAKGAPPGPEETVTLKRSELVGILERLDKQDQDISRLSYAADKNRLERFDSRMRKPGPNVFTLSIADGKIITGWRKLKDESYKDTRTGGLVENQRYEVLFNDGSKTEVNGYLAFSDIRYNETVKAEEVSRKTDDRGLELTVKVIEEGSPFFGKELVVDSRFVN